MQTRSTTEFTIPLSRAWVNAVVAATCCLGAPASAEREPVARRYTLPCTKSTSVRLFDGNGEVSVVDGNVLMYLDGAQVENALATRETSEQEKAIAQLRGWKLYSEDWDGDGASAPINSSLEQASKFVCALKDGAMIPEPMLHQNGKAGLFWSSEVLYGDLEFLENGQIAYYIEKGGDRHKGIVDFNGQEIPAVFSTLLDA